MGLLASISLLVMVTVVTLWRMQLRAAPSAAPGLTAHPGAAASDQMLIANHLAGGLPSAAEQQSYENSTAILFLIDESGGVSGRCDAVDPDNVFVTDPQGRRYELVRFYLQLWRAYYRFLQEEQRLDSLAQPISLGIMQFAKENQTGVFLEVSAIRDLLNERGVDLFNQLRSQESMLAEAGGDANWFCWTDFPSALDIAAEELNSSQAKHKVLVLLTDGSTRGNESENETLVRRSAARQSIEDTLRRLKQSDIEVLTVIWRGDECRNENDCRLDDDEFRQRKDDLRGWESWESDDLLTLVDDKQVIKALAATQVFAPMLPGVGQFATGWFDGTTDQTTWSYFSEVARLLKVIVITSEDTNPGNIIFRPQSISGGNHSNFSRLSFQSQESQWYLAESNITGSPATCPQRALEISINEPVLAYYWLPFEQDWPKIKSVSVEPEEIHIDRLVAGVIPSEDRIISVNVQMEPIDMNHHNCFLVQVSVGDNTYAEHLPSNNSQLSFPAIILPDDLAHGPTAISAQLVFANAPEVSAGVEKTAELNITFQPIFPERIEFTSVNGSENVTVTVPITFAAQVPGFEPKFGLFPDEFDPDTASPPIATTPGPNHSPNEENCPDTDPLDGVFESNSSTITSDSVSEFVTSYTAVFPSRAIERCGYKYLLAKWSSSDNEGHTWIDLAGMDTNFAGPTTTTLTPLPTETPPTVGGGGNGKGLPVWAVVPIVLIVLVLVAIGITAVKKKRK